MSIRGEERLFIIRRYFISFSSVTSILTSLSKILTVKVDLIFLSLPTYLYFGFGRNGPLLFMTSTINNQVLYYASSQDTCNRKSLKKTFFANPSQYKYLLFQSHYIKLKPPGIPSILYILHGANQNLGSEKSMQLSHGVMLH